MKELTIEIELSNEGTLEAETFGFKGPICEKELKKLLEKDFIVSDVDKKDDYYKSEDDVSVIKKIKGGII